MPPSQNTPTQANTAVILEQIKNLADDVKGINERLDRDAQDTRLFRENYIQGHAEVANSVKLAHARIDAHETSIKDIKDAMLRLEKAVSPLIFSNTIMKFLGSAVMLAIIALIWAILTHQVTLGF